MANELPFDVDRRLHTAFTVSAYLNAASQSLSRHPVTKRKKYMRNVLDARKEELRRGSASSAEGKQGIRLRPQKRPRHLSPELTHADLKSACLRMLSLLPEPKYSLTSGGALAVGPPREAVSSSGLKAQSSRA